MKIDNMDDAEVYGELKYYSEEGFRFRTEPSKPLPENLFKYYSLNEDNLNAFMGSYLFASHPFNLNDILDSKLELIKILEKPDKISYKSIYDGMDEGFRNKVSFDDYYLKETDGSFYKSELYFGSSSKLGIISLSENGHSSLMWPHYTQERGFQLNFKTLELIDSIKNYNDSKSKCSDLEYLGINPINYVKAIWPLDLSHFIKENKTKLLLNILYNIKHDQWKYEQEWRILVSRPWMGIPFSNYFTGVKDWSADIKNRHVCFNSKVVDFITLSQYFFISNVYSKIEEVSQESRIIKTFYFSESSTLKDEEIIIRDLHKRLFNFLFREFQKKIYISVHEYFNSYSEIRKSKRQIEIIQVTNEFLKLNFYN